MKNSFTDWWRNPPEGSLLFIASIIASVIVVVRTQIFGTDRYLFLIWNLFLAWIPYLLANWMTKNEKPDKFFLIGGLALWLLFFPNAPYLITDFLHLKNRGSITRWYDVMMLFTFSWIGLMLGFSSLRKLQIRYFNKLEGIRPQILIGGILLLTGFGVYLGRYLRWNSWDIISNPLGLIRDVLKLILHPLDNLNFTGFIIVFTLFLIIGYATYCSRIKPEN